MPTDVTFECGNGPPQGELGSHLEPFLNSLRALGYAESKLPEKRRIATSFIDWTKCNCIAVSDLGEVHMVRYLQHTANRSKASVAWERAALKLFLRYLRHQGIVPFPPAPIGTSPAGEVERRYEQYLRNERGLAENSLRVYMPFVRDFLAEQVASSGTLWMRTLDAQRVCDFVLDRVRNRSGEYCRLLAASLRSFLRYLFLRENTEANLSLSVPTIRRWGQAHVNAFLTPEEIERVLSATDQTTPTGCRDYAILLLLAQLGLRAAEVVALELGDVCWRTGEILIHGKGRELNRLPLLAEVGEALALYIKRDRGSSASQRVFLRNIAPRVGLTGPAAIGHVVRRAFSRAGLRRSSRRGAAHLFRHSLATRMIRHDASIAEISEVLRHRSQATTQIYAKVDFETLRGVARAWPRTGGAQ